MLDGLLICFEWQIPRGAPSMVTPTGTGAQVAGKEGMGPRDAHAQRSICQGGLGVKA